MPLTAILLSLAQTGFRLAPIPHVAAKAGDLLRGAEFPLKPGAKELLISLQSAGVVCAVASSSSAQEVEIRLARAGILHFIAGYAGGDEAEQGKPDPAVYMLAAERIGIAPFCCLAFEDTARFRQAEQVGARGHGSDEVLAGLRGVGF